jgi:hypothetical protein
MSQAFEAREANRRHVSLNEVELETARLVGRCRIGTRWLPSHSDFFEHVMPAINATASCTDGERNCDCNRFRHSWRPPRSNRLIGILDVSLLFACSQGARSGKVAQLSRGPLLKLNQPLIEIPVLVAQNPPECGATIVAIVTEVF